SLLLIVLIPPTYLLCFANINRPHDYYQLIITPFLAIVSGYGFAWIATYLAPRISPSLTAQRTLAIASLSIYILISAFTYLVWMRAPTLDQPLLRFEKLCAGRFNPKGPAMVYVSTEVSGLDSDFYIPQYVYAANLWGYGRTVKNAEGARGYFEALAPAFPKMEYVLFYGMKSPDWIPEKNFHLEVQDDRHQLYVFRRTPGN
ncbi:MAG: hypothetical protein ABIQ35_06500, partial [Verrucomicrobiota bacterium]